MSLKAIDAAVQVAGTFGLRVDDPVLLRSTNNVVAWLRPTSIVAKVRVGHHSGFCREIRVASELNSVGGPVALPANELPPIVHIRNEFKITFWRYYPQQLEHDIPHERIESALRHLHEACAKISPELRAELPSYLEELECVSLLLRDAKKLAALPESDRLFLIQAFERLDKRMQALSPTRTHRVIHGSPHSYNILLVDDQPCFIDFETTCVGPYEWDLAHALSDTPRDYSDTLNQELLEVCRHMISVKTAAWCWADVNRGDLRYHAEMHLANLKKSFDEFLEQ